MKKKEKNQKNTKNPKKQNYNSNHHKYKHQHHNHQKNTKIEMPPENNDNSNNEEEIEGEESNEFTINLSMIYFDQCDPKKCTGKKLQKLGLLSETKFYPNYPGILLTPTGKKIVSIEDSKIIAEHGICVLDCSWAKFNELKLNLSKIETRSLPYMVAVNPVNYGKAYKLTCAEAIAATMLLGGFEREAKFIMNHFKWGPSFFDVNQELFNLYLKAKTQEEIKQMEDNYIKEEMESKKKRKNSDGLRELDEELKREEEEEEENEDDKEELMNMFKNINVDELTDQITKHD